MTEEQLAELERLHQKATPGSWRECGHDRGGCICGQVWSESTDQFLFKPDAGDEVPVPTQENKLANAALVATMRNVLPELLALARLGKEDRAHTRFREDVLLSMGVDLSWYRRDVLPGEVDEDPEEGEADEKLARLESALEFLSMLDDGYTLRRGAGVDLIEAGAIELGWDGKAGA